ncbi:MAG: radical SAM protein [Prevotellaceae bacterium]|jgi:radical SAM protein with 4Fe4S-binding SPASM domain|nr:radical SAM protein [Prevotellaceae bacterium]
MERSGELYFDDVLLFADTVVVEQMAEDVWLVISVETANWIVLYTPFQRVLLENLIEGKSVGTVSQMIETGDEMGQLQALLSALTAREFAVLHHKPNPQYAEGYKMLNLYVTNACNLRCKHCFMWSGVKLKEELRIEDWLRILTDFKNNGGEYVTFSGGEPLMNKDFPSLVRHVAKLGLQATILSNGLLWTDVLIDELADSISEIQFSIDGVDEESNAKLRGEDHFDKVVDSVIRFANKGVRVSVATTFTFDNLQDDISERYQQLIDEIKSRTAYPVFFKLSKKVLSGRDVQYTAEENARFSEKINAIERSIDENASYQNFMEGHHPNFVMRNCGFGGISVGADGKVYFCNRISEVEDYGNIREQSFASFIQRAKEIHEQTAVEHVEPCAHCELRYICGGGCRIDDFDFAGKLKNKGTIIHQTSCTPEKKRRLMQKMVDSFTYYYQF